jgi:hypothetical protein
MTVQFDNQVFREYSTALRQGVSPRTIARALLGDPHAATEPQFAIVVELVVIEMLAHLHAPSLKLGPDSPLLSLDSCQVPENILGETPSGQQLLVDVLLKLAPGVRGKIIATAQNTLKFLQGAIV